MLFKILIICQLAYLAYAVPTVMPSPETVDKQEQLMDFKEEQQTKKHDDYNDDKMFHTSHKIVNYDVDGELRNMNLHPTKERPELNPVLSALINEDVMKSIEAKRAIEKAELDAVQAEMASATKSGSESPLKSDSMELEKKEKSSSSTEIPPVTLTTHLPLTKAHLDDDDSDMIGFVDQAINFEGAGSENKKSRIEIKKGPNGQDYEYEYVYYYEDEDDEVGKVKAAPEEAIKAESRGKSRYTNIERSSVDTPTENSLSSGHAKGRSSNVEQTIEAERLPANTRFPSRAKATDAAPTPSLDSMETAAEKKKISVKRPNLEAADTAEVTMDEKKNKNTRNGDTEASKATLTTEPEAAVQATAQAAAESHKATKTVDVKEAKDAENEEDTTPPMQKSALDLYAILANENNNMEATTVAIDTEVTTILPDSTDNDENVTVLSELNEPSSTTTTTTTTTTPKPTTTTTTTTSTTTTTTTTTTTPAPVFNGKRPGIGGGPRNRYKPKFGNGSAGAAGAAGAAATTTSTTETPSSHDQPKNGKNRFSRPSIGGRNRHNGKTTAAPAHQETEEANQSVKEVKPVSNGFGRSKPRNRFNGRTTTTTESSVNGKSTGEEENGATTTARTLRGRPSLNVRNRNRVISTKAPANGGSGDGAEHESENSVDDKAAAPVNSVAPKINRFNINRVGNNRLPARSKFTKATTEAAPTGEEAPVENDIKPEDADKPVAAAAPPTNGLKNLNNRPRPGALQKTDKLKTSASPLASLGPRKVNPLLAKKRLPLGVTSTEAPVNDETVAAGEMEDDSDKEETAESSNSESKVEKEEEQEETTTKAQPRGLALLGQRRRLPLRKPGTSL